MFRPENAIFDIKFKISTSKTAAIFDIRFEICQKWQNLGIGHYTRNVPKT